MRLIIIVGIILLLVTACASESEFEILPEDQDQEAPGQDVVIEQVEPPVTDDVADEEDGIIVEDEEPVEEAETEDTWLSQSLVSNDAINVVSCDPETRELRLIITNTGEKRWIFHGNVPWPTPADVIEAELFINSYEASRDRPYYDPETKERYFGPGDTFPENCEGKTALAPGEEMRCILVPVPLFPPGGPVLNKVRVSAPEAAFPVEFACES